MNQSQHREYGLVMALYGEKKSGWTRIYIRPNIYVHILIYMLKDPLQKRLGLSHLSSLTSYMCSDLLKVSARLVLCCFLNSQPPSPNTHTRVWHTVGTLGQSGLGQKKKAKPSEDRHFLNTILLGLAQLEAGKDFCFQLFY